MAVTGQALEPHAIELRLKDVSQLFNNLDPFPFRERDLAPEAETYIVNWAQDLPKNRPIEIVIHLPSGDCGGPSADIAPAIAIWFADKAKAESRAIRQLFRDGRLAFLIGVAVLSVCLLIAWSLTQRYADAPFARIVQESLIIVGWVVIWRPAEMFLYDWLPMLRRRNLFRRLARAAVTIRGAGATDVADAGQSGRR